jgi:hypothetical protein
MGMTLSAIKFAPSNLSLRHSVSQTVKETVDDKYNMKKNSYYDKRVNVFSKFIKNTHRADKLNS